MVGIWGVDGDPYRKGIVELDKDESAKAIIPDNEMVIPCQIQEVNRDPMKSPKLPDLPDLPGTGLSEEERRKETKLIKIAILTWKLVGLTNKGHVLVLDGLYDEDSTGTWRYVCKSAQTILYPHSNGDIQLPNYSEIGKVKENPAFHVTTGDDGGERPPEVELSSDTMLITHVSHIASTSSEFLSKTLNAQVSADNDKFFFAYSSSVVLMGDSDVTPETLPTIIPGLQNRSVISVVSGAYHFGALTSSGKLLTWGGYSYGALGLGDPTKLPAGSPGGYTTEEQRAEARSLPPDVMVPTEVRFDHGLKAKGRVRGYCLAAAAGIFNTAAFVVDLAEDEDPPEGLE